MQVIDLKDEQLDEGVKDTLTSVLGMFKKNNVRQLRTKYMKLGDNRIFATENIKGEVYVSIFNGKKKIREEQFTNIAQADKFLEQYKQEGYETVKKPSQIKKAGTWLGTAVGGFLSFSGAFSAGYMGAGTIASIMHGIPGAVGATTAAFAILGGTVMVISIVVGASGWIVVKSTEKRRQEISDEMDVINLSESINAHSDFELDESVKDVLASVANVFKRKDEGKFRTKYLKKGENRIFATEDLNGKVHVTVYDGKKKVQDKNFGSINQAETFLSEFEQNGYKTISNPSSIKKAATWLGTVAGGLVTANAALTIGIGGVIIAGSLISAGAMGSGAAIIGAGISIAVNLLTGTAGWVVVKFSNEKRREMKRDKEVINLKESVPPSDAAEEFVKSNKERFKKQYGEDWDKVLYALAWKKYNNGDL